MIEYLIPENRLQTYKKIQGIKEQDIIDVYFVLQDISSKLFIPLQSLEVFLRNRIDEQLKCLFSRNDWYNDTKFYMSPLSKIALDKTVEKLQNDIKTRSIVPDDIIANLTFGFWVSMHHRSYVSNDPNNFWHKSFTEVYKDFTHKKLITLEDKLNNIYNQLVIVNDTRNRLYHYESLWRKKDSSQDFRSAINMINEKYKTILRVLKHLDINLENKIKLLKPCLELQTVFQNIHSGAPYRSLY